MTRFRAVMTCIADVAASLIGFAAEPVGAVPAAPTTAPDLLAASDTGGSSTDNITGVVTPTFTVVCGTGVNSVNLYVNGVASGTAPCAGATTNVNVASPLSSGTYAARYTRLDALGDESPLSTASLSFTVDATAPAAPSMPPDLQAASDLGTFDDDNVTKDNTPTFSLSCTNGDSVTLFIDGASAGTAGCSGGTAAVTTAVLLDGVHAATYSEADPYANTSALSPALTLTIDTVYYDIRLERADMQAASDTGSSPTDNNTSDTTPTIQTACNAGDMVRWWLNFSTYWGIAPCVDGLAVFTHTVPLANGTQKISFDRIDLAGASAWRSQDLTLTIDSVAPNIPGAPNLQAASDTGTSNTDDLTNDTTPTFDVACETGTTVTLLMAGTALTSFPCYSGNSWLTLTLANGTHTVSAIDTDVAGNVSGSSLSFTFTIDTTPPSAPGTAPDLNAASDSGWSNTDNLTNNAYPTLTFACANAFVNLTTDTKAPVTAPCVGGTASITTVGLTDGAHTMKYTETDAAGNVGAFSPGLVVTIDTVGTLRPTNAPDLHASSDTGSSSVDNITRSTTPTFTIACTTGNLSILVVDSVNNGWTECLGGTSTIAATALSEGAHTIAYRSADYAGNQSNIGSVALAITIDTTAPTTTTPDLVTASDTGTSTTDNITNDTTATINIEAPRVS